MHKRSLLVLLLICLPLGVRSATTINLYIATTGSDSTGTGTQALPYATLAKALTRIPSGRADTHSLDGIYQINVADGTYAAPVNLLGYTAPIFDNSTGYPAGLVIVGNTSTPANVVFTGTCADLGVSTNGACIGNGLPVTLNGITINTTAAFGVACDHCIATFENMTVTGTLSTAGIVSVGGYMYFGPAVTVSGFNPTLGIGIDLNYNSSALLTSGTLTITGPGGNNTAFGLVAEFQSVFRIHPFTGSPNVTITGVQNGIQMTANSHFVNYDSAGTVSITNTATSSGTGYGIQAGGTSGYSQSAGALTVDHFSTCLYAFALAEIDQGPGNRTLTNCTATNAIQGSQIVIF